MSMRAIRDSIRIVKKRIRDEYDPEWTKYIKPIRDSETGTRYALIDPLLRACGWALDDPAQVEVEFPQGHGRIDYVLWNSESDRQIFIEAKHLGTDLTNHNRQLAEYVRGERSGTAVLTNGDVWCIYDLSLRGRFKQKNVAEFSIVDDPLTESTAAAYKWLRRK